MKTTLDSVTIDIPCPGCHNKTSQTIGQLKSKRDMVCRHCGITITLDASDMRREIAKVEQQLAQLERSVRRLGK